MGGPGSGRKAWRSAKSAAAPANVPRVRGTPSTGQRPAPTATAPAIAKSATAEASTGDDSAKAVAYEAMVQGKAYLAEMVAGRAPAGEITKCRASLLNATRLYGKLNGEGEITEAMIVRSTAWERVMLVLNPVLARHPKCRAEFMAALAKIE